MDFKEFLGNFNHFFTLFLVFPLFIGLGVYLTIKLRFIQIRKLKASFSYLTKKGNSETGNISRFEAISTVLAGNFGTGNISGMAVAITTGGPGALVWMWIMAFFGAIIQYASCYLGSSYRFKTKDNEYVGGPMYYLRDGLGYKKTAVLFALFTLFGAVTIGNFAQINSIILPLEKMGANPVYCCAAIAGLVAIVIFGGIQRIAAFASYIVPFKALLYLGTALAIILMNYDKIIPSLTIMFEQAFDFSSFVGGLTGITVLKAMTTGFDRGIFATDAGTGIVPILQASARSSNPVADGISTLIAPLMVMIVCTATGLVLILTGAWLQPGLESTNMVTHAFSKGLQSPIGGHIVIVSLVLFAYTTILAWFYCGEKALGFLVGQQKARLFRYVYLAMIPIGAFTHVSLIWTLADIAVTFMLVTNLIGVIGLSGRVIESTREYQLA